MTSSDLVVATAYAQEAWQDEITFSLAPGESTGTKSTTEVGGTRTYAWAATGGRINFDLHTHAGSDALTYEKGRGQTSGEGSSELSHAGGHGWFCRVPPALCDHGFLT